MLARILESLRSALLTLQSLLAAKAPNSPKTAPERTNMPETTQTPPAASKLTLTDLATGIKEYEGWGPPGSTINGVYYASGTPSFRNHNPGNCRFSHVGYLPKYQPVLCSAAGFAIFKDDDTGWEYLLNLLKEKIEVRPNLSLLEFMSSYAPRADGNDPVAYASWIARRLGVETSIAMKQFL